MEHWEQASHFKTKEALWLFVRTESCVLSDIGAGPGIT